MQEMMQVCGTIIKRQRRWIRSLLEHHSLHGASVDLYLRPLDRKPGRLEKLLVRIFLIDVLAGKVAFRELLHKHIVTLHQLLLGVPRVEHKRLILKKEGIINCQIRIISN